MFVTTRIKAREAKLSLMAQLSGWNVACILIGKESFTPEPHRYFSEVICVGTAEQALQTVDGLQPNLVHLFAGAAEEELLTFSRRCAFPTALDLNDVWSPVFFDVHPERFPIVQELLFNCSGYCARDSQAYVAEATDGLFLPPIHAFIPEFAWGSQLGRTSRVMRDLQTKRKSLAKLLRRKPPRLAAIGMFLPETSGWRDSGLLESAKMLIGQGIEFHIFAHWSYGSWINNGGDSRGYFAQNFGEYLELAASSELLRMRRPVAPELLPLILSSFDGAYHVVGSPVVGQHLGLYKTPYIQSGLAGRIADYIDAGIPVVANREMTCNWEKLNELGIGIDVATIFTPSKEGNLADQIRRIEVSAALKRSQETYSVTANSTLIGELYREILEC